MNRGGCAGDCENTVGSFKCSCSEGFQLAGDQMNCVGKISKWSNSFGVLMWPFFLESDANECLQIEDNSCEQTCIYIPGSYSCDCRSGFTLGSNGFSCNRKTLMGASNYDIINRVRHVAEVVKCTNNL